MEYEKQYRAHKHRRGYTYRPPFEFGVHGFRFVLAEKCFRGTRYGAEIALIAALHHYDDYHSDGEQRHYYHKRDHKTGI